MSKKERLALARLLREWLRSPAYSVDMFDRTWAAVRKLESKE